MTDLRVADPFRAAGEYLLSAAGDTSGTWHNIVRWCEERGASFWPGQEEMLRAIAERRRVAIVAGNSVGKGYVVAWATRWWLEQPASRAVLTSNTNGQLRKNTCHELKYCHGRYGWAGRAGMEYMELPGGRRADGATTDDPNVIQGFHAPRLLTVFDEPSGPRLRVLWPEWKKLAGDRGKDLMTGNYNFAAGKWADILQGGVPGWHVLRVRSDECADWQMENRRIPGLATWEQIAVLVAECADRDEPWHADLSAWLKAVVEPETSRLPAELLEAVRTWVREEGHRHDTIRVGVLALKPIEEVKGALWTHDLIDRVGAAPHLVRVVVAADPQGKDTVGETGIVGAGLGADGHFYVLVDASLSSTPGGWGRRLVDTYRALEADVIVGEVNYGGDMVEHVVQTVDRNVPFKAVRATRGKAKRAEPVVALYEQGRVHHVGRRFSQLEEEMVTWDQHSSDWSPNRLDALVWALTELASHDTAEQDLIFAHDADVDDMESERERLRRELGLEG